MRVVIKETTAQAAGAVTEATTVETEIGGRVEEVLQVLERLGIAETEEEPQEIVVNFARPGCGGACRSGARLPREFISRDIGGQGRPWTRTPGV